MYKEGPIAEASRALESHAQRVRTVAPEEDDAYLGDFLKSWLQNGSGIEETGGEYETYLRVVLNLADQALRGELDVNYRGTPEQNYEDARQRRIVAIDDEGPTGGYALDRATYEQIRFRFLNAGRGLLEEERLAIEYRNQHPGMG
jgi:hypothetical protein